MIPISLPMLFIIYIYCWFIVLIILWLREQLRTYISDWKRNRNNHFQCDNCHYTFIEQRLIMQFNWTALKSVENK
ncbi:hypothetical protein AAEX28_09835 [Lentisphaerota bacterium WC36G]|nr:hypothetical protein LJT99_12670 [Lentisphaerae bacterium WC36]